MEYQPPAVEYRQVEPAQSDLPEDIYQPVQKISAPDEWQEVREEARQKKPAQEKISSLEEDREQQDRLFEERIKQLDNAKKPEQQQVALQDVLSSVSNTASLSVTLLSLYHEYRRKHQADDDMLAKEHFTIEDQIHRVRELAKLRDDGYITPDEFERKKEEFLALTEDQRDTAARRTFLRRFFRKHDPPPS